MAVKRECDRCKRQWEPIGDTPSRVDAYPPSKELCTVMIDIPLLPDQTPKAGTREWVKRPGIKQDLDMCQDCAREVYEFATTIPDAKTGIYPKS